MLVSKSRRSSRSATRPPPRRTRRRRDGGPFDRSARTCDPTSHLYCARAMIALGSKSPTKRTTAITPTNHIAPPGSGGCGSDAPRGGLAQVAASSPILSRISPVEFLRGRLPNFKRPAPLFRDLPDYVAYSGFHSVQRINENHFGIVEAMH